MIGDFDVDLAHEFFQGFVNHALVTLHIDNLRGDNAHHQCETVFKAFARALRMAVELDPRAARRRAVDQGQRSRADRAVRMTRSPSSTTAWATCARWRRRSSTSRRDGEVRASPPIRDDDARRRARRVPGPGRDARLHARAARAGCARRCCDAARDKPLLGVCIGMQMLLRAQRGGRHRRARACCRGRVRRFRLDGRCSADGSRYKVPQMGWNEVLPGAAAPAVGGHCRTARCFYFVHSYYAAPARPRATARRHATTARALPARWPAITFSPPSSIPRKARSAGLRSVQLRPLEALSR